MAPTMIEVEDQSADDLKFMDLAVEMVRAFPKDAAKEKRSAV